MIQERTDNIKKQLRVNRNVTVQLINVPIHETSIITNGVLGVVDSDPPIPLPIGCEEQKRAILQFDMEGTLVTFQRVTEPVFMLRQYDTLIETIQIGHDQTLPTPPPESKLFSKKFHVEQPHRRVKLMFLTQ